MYHLYHTDAIVLGSEPFGEGHKLISLFTRELGLRMASAQSVREERSKLRYGLQDFSYSRVSLVRGKEFWRLTGAELVHNVSFDAERPDALRMLGRIFKLLRRLLPPEERNVALFEALRDGMQFAKEAPSKPLVDGAEIVLVLRILYLLGYLARREEFEPFLSECTEWGTEVFSAAASYRALALREINQSLKASQL